MEIRDKKILIIGMGKTGLATAKFLSAMGGQVTIADTKEDEELRDQLSQLKGWPINSVVAGWPKMEAGKFDFLVTSPGVPMEAEPLQLAVKLGIPVLSEIELASRFIENTIVAVSGTNGKTTTTALIGEMFKDAGRPITVAGNIGIPFIQEVGEKAQQHIYIVEVSSFQLEWVEEFCPQIALLTNLTPDHLERHGNMETYLATKARIFRRQGPEDFTILNYDDPAIRALARETKGQVIFFSRRHKVEKGVFANEGSIYINFGSSVMERICSVDALAMPGAHNLENALGAIAVGWVMGLTGQQMSQTLKNFSGVPHRLERVKTIKGVEYINDSKGTNPEASIKALDAFNQSIILIAGGSAKGEVDFHPFAQKIKEKVRELILMGDTSPAIREAVEKTGFKQISNVTDLEAGVFLASGLAQKGDIVLLSPASASFDAFRNFEHRGEVFKKIVHQLD